MCRRKTGIDADPQPGTARKRRQTVGLGGPDQRIGDQDIIQPRIDHHFGFTELLASDAPCPQFHLAMREGRNLMGLDMGAQIQTMAVAIGLHLLEIVLDDLQVDDRNRRV